LLAGVLSDALLSDPDGPQRAVEAGRQWGRRLAATSADPITAVDEAVDRLVELLDTYGFAPELDGGAARDSAGAGAVAAGSGKDGEDTRPVALPMLSARHCPFLELAAAHQRIVCAVHLGLMRGALEGWGAPVRA